MHFYEQDILWSSTKENAIWFADYLLVLCYHSYFQMFFKTPNYQPNYIKSKLTHIALIPNSIAHFS